MTNQNLFIQRLLLFASAFSLGLLLLIIYRLDVHATYSFLPNQVLGVTQPLSQKSPPYLTQPISFPYIDELVETIPNVSARSVVVLDTKSMYQLYTLRAHEQLPVASLTKIAAALVVIEDMDVDAIVTVPTDIEKIVGSQIGLRPKEQIAVGDLLKGMLISSGNDAAYTLAVNHPRGYDVFVQRMNEIAYNVGLRHSQFLNPIGYDVAHHYSTAQDMVLLAKKLLSYPLLQDIVQTQSVRLTGNEGEVVHSLKNTNPLLGKVADITGVKTGTSDVAGENFIFSKKIGERTIIVVILGSQNRDVDATMLNYWIDEHYK